MPILTIAYRNEAERLALEQAIAYVTALLLITQDAPPAESSLWANWPFGRRQDRSSPR
jgi:hypothetical protein